MACGKRRLKDSSGTKKEESKISKVLHCGPTGLAQYSKLGVHHACKITWLVTWYVDIASFWSWPRERDLIINHLLAYRTERLIPFSFPLPYSLLPLHFNPFPFTLLYFPLPFYLNKFILKSLSSSFGQKNFGLRNNSLSHIRSILLSLEFKQCPLTLASVLACAHSAVELRL